MNNDAICDLTAENGNMKALLVDLRVVVEMRINILKQLFPEVTTNDALENARDQLRRIDVFLEDWGKE